MSDEGREKIELSPREIHVAASVGALRQTSNLARQRKDAHGAKVELGWQYHIEGAMGEYAFAKHMNLFWSGAHEIGAADVAPDWEVRTRSLDWHDLIVHPEDYDDRKFVLITGVNGTYRIRGWILGREAKQQEFWKDPAGGRPAFFLPQCELEPIK